MTTAKSSQQGWPRTVAPPSAPSTDGRSGYARYGQYAGQLRDAVIAGFEHRCVLSIAFLRAPHVNCRHAEPTRSTHVWLPGVTDEDRSRRVDSQCFGCTRVDARMRFARPRPRRRDGRVNQTQQSDLLQIGVEFPTPVRADPDGDTGLL